MERHDVQHGVAFAAPPDWVERSIVSFCAPAPPGTKNAPNIVLTEEPMREGETLNTYSSRYLAELAQQLPHFDVVETSETTLGGLPATFVRFLWVSNLGGIEQSITLVERAASSGRVVFSLTSTASAENAEQMRPMFAEIARSIRFDAQETTRTVSDVAPRPSPAPAQTPETLFMPELPMPGARRVTIKERS
jgi:hypothetical protein